MTTEKKNFRNIRAAMAPEGSKGGTAKTERLAQILSEEVPFEYELPYFFDWPSGQRRFSDRAVTLMLAGLQMFDQQYRSSKDTDRPDSTKNSDGDEGAANEKKDPNAKSKPLDGW